jgi:TolB-like protein/Flp pilus assembly protein TadD
MATAQCNSQACREELERVLASACFARSEGLARLLRFLVERQLESRESELKESVIGVEVYGRSPDYNPRLDSTVRSEAVRLRARLTNYYANEGRADPVVIELPKGGYVPRFRQAEVSPETPPSFPELKARLGGRQWLAFALAAGAVMVAAGFWWSYNRNVPVPLAVLPFTNLSADPGDEYFADGLTDEIIRDLSIIDGLAVRSQTSSFAFKGKPRNVREVGSQMEADYVLEGSVLRLGQQLRINAQLVRVRDDSPLWSARYDRELTDLLAIQDEISRGIVNSLRLKLGRGRRRYETSTEAYDLYLHARASATHLFAGDDEVAGLFDKAIAKDPSLAPAWAGLAGAYASQSFVNPNGRDHADKLAKMRAAAEKAIQLDPLLAEAHSALGTAYARDAQWDQAELSLRRAIQIDPNLSIARHNFAWFFLFPLGRIEEAIREARAEVGLDPLSPQAHYLLAETLTSAGRYDEAAVQCEKLPADFVFTNDCLGRARLGQGRTAEAIRVLASANSWGYLAYAYGRAGRREEAEKLMAEAPMLYPNRRGGFQYALAFAGLGDKDRTIDQLEGWAGVGPVRIGFTLTAPEFAFVRADSRVKALRKKVGLPE